MCLGGGWKKAQGVILVLPVAEIQEHLLSGMHTHTHTEAEHSGYRIFQGGLGCWGARHVSPKVV